MVLILFVFLMMLDICSRRIVKSNNVFELGKLLLLLKIFLEDFWFFCLLLCFSFDLGGGVGEFFEVFLIELFRLGRFLFELKLILFLFGFVFLVENNDYNSLLIVK